MSRLKVFCMSVNWQWCTYVPYKSSWVQWGDCRKRQSGRQVRVRVLVIKLKRGKRTFNLLTWYLIYRQTQEESVSCYENSKYVQHRTQSSSEESNHHNEVRHLHDVKLVGKVSSIFKPKQEETIDKTHLDDIHKSTFRNNCIR